MDMRVAVEALRAYMKDHAGSAAFSGFPGALADVIEIDGLDAYDLLRKAERMGIDVSRFAVEDHDFDHEDDEFIDDFDEFDEW